MGLVKETWVKPLIGTISVTLIKKRLGVLHKDDYGPVKNAIRQMVDSVFLT